MMLKKKSKVKLGGAVFLALLFGISYIGISFYSVPEKVSAADTWFSKEETRTLADIKYLQEMNITICENSSIGDKNNSVIDIRDNSAYSIAKLSDNKCWMTQNLRVTRGTIRAKDPSNTTGKISYSDTNISGYYNIPASTSGAFSEAVSNNFYTNQQVHAAVNDSYGAYYSHNVATAGVAMFQDSGAAAQDICPKGWRLPTGGILGEYKSLYDRGSIKVGGWDSNSLTSGYWLGGDSAQAIGAAFFPAAGKVNNVGLDNLGKEGRYWSSTIESAPFAYTLYFTPPYGNQIELNAASVRAIGATLRCVANENQLPPAQTDSASGSISVKVANTLSIDAVSGMEKEVDSTSVASGTITATIAANTSYKVLLSAEKTSLTSASTTNDAEIPALPTVQAGTNAWGILNADNTTYSAITNQEKEYYHTTTPSTNPDILGTIHTFTVGISVSPSLSSDTYSTDVTITAVAA